LKLSNVKLLLEEDVSALNTADMLHDLEYQILEMYVGD
jgi:hypothetical protein